MVFGKEEKFHKTKQASMKQASNASMNFNEGTDFVQLAIFPKTNFFTAYNIVRANTTTNLTEGGIRIRKTNSGPSEFVVERLTEDPC